MSIPRKKTDSIYDITAGSPPNANGGFGGFGAPKSIAKAKESFVSKPKEHFHTPGYDSIDDITAGSKPNKNGGFNGFGEPVDERTNPTSDLKEVKKQKWEFSRSDWNDEDWRSYYRMTASRASIASCASDKNTERYVDLCMKEHHDLERMREVLDSLTPEEHPEYFTTVLDLRKVPRELQHDWGKDVLPKNVPYLVYDWKYEDMYGMVWKTRYYEPNN